MAAPPGWYHDASRPTSLRWWDGTRWTGHVTPVKRGRRWWIPVVVVVAVAACLPWFAFCSLMGLQVFLTATCPTGATCSLDPTEAAMAVTLHNDTEEPVTVVQMGCPDNCESPALAPGSRMELGTSVGGYENLYLVRSSMRGVLGCFPLLYWRRPASEPELAVSQAGECLLLRNDLHVPIGVEVRCPTDCDWSPLGDTIQPGSSGLTGLDSVHAFRVSEVHGPGWWPLTPGRVLGCVTSAGGQHDVTLLASSLPMAVNC